MKTQLDSRVDRLIKAIDEQGGDRAKLEFPLRAELLRLKSEIAGLNLPQEVINFVAEKIDSNVRDLEDFSTELIAYSVSQRKPLDTEMARRFLGLKKRKIRK